MNNELDTAMHTDTFVDVVSATGKAVAADRVSRLDPAPNQPVRVAIVDDDDFVRRALTAIIARGGCEVVGQAKDGDQVAALVSATEPDVVIMDVRMERMDGITATSILKRCPHAPGVIALTSFDSEATILDAVAAGVDGFLAKDSDPKEFVAAIHQVAAGQGSLSPRATRVLMESARSGSSAPAASVVKLDVLTPKELEAVQLLTAGCSNAEIAAKMFISETSAKTHLSSATLKLGAKNRVHLAVLAVQAELAK